MSSNKDLVNLYLLFKYSAGIMSMKNFCILLKMRRLGTGQFTKARSLNLGSS